MNVEIRAEAALFPEKEYINAIAVAVWLGFVVQTLIEVNPTGRTLYSKRPFMTFFSEWAIHMTLII
jgi:hypothetical protein